MGVTVTAGAKQCPRCHAFELIYDERSHRDNDVEFFRVCGFVRDDRSGDIPLPHYCLRYDKEGVSTEKLDNIEKFHGNMPIDNLADAESWLNTLEVEGYNILKCVAVNRDGHIIWLRGCPAEYIWISPI